VDAERIGESMPMGQFGHPGKAGRLDGGDHHHRDAGVARAGQQRVAVLVECVGVQVAVGVDPHRRQFQSSSV